MGCKRAGVEVPNGALQPFSPSEIDDLHNGDAQHEGKADGIAQGMVEFRHVEWKRVSIGLSLKVHAPHSCQKGEGNKDGRNHG